MRVIAVLSVAASAVVACSGGNGPRPLGSSGGTPPVAPPNGLADASDDRDAGDAEAGPIACVAPTLSGGDVVAIAYAASAPIDQGGAITDGTYDLTAITLYLGVDGEDPDAGDGGVVDAGTSAHARATLVLGNGTLASARSDDGAPTAVKNATEHVDGVELVVDETCPGDSSQQIPFTASGDMLTLHTTMTRFETYTRRR